MKSSRSGIYVGRNHFKRYLLRGKPLPETGGLFSQATGYQPWLPTLITNPDYQPWLPTVTKSTKWFNRLTYVYLCLCHNIPYTNGLWWCLPGKWGLPPTKISLAHLGGQAAMLVPKVRWVDRPQRGVNEGVPMSCRTFLVRGSWPVLKTATVP